LLKLKTIKFAEDFSKLDKEYFTSIRKPSKNLKSGNVYEIKTPTREFKAALVTQSKVRLCEIPEKTLLQDTCTQSRIQAVNKLCEFYPKLTEASPVRLLWFKHVTEEAA